MGGTDIPIETGGGEEVWVWNSQRVDRGWKDGEKNMERIKIIYKKKKKAEGIKQASPLLLAQLLLSNVQLAPPSPISRN